MKKLLVIVAIIMLIMINSKSDTIIIPESSIRYRVVANSNSANDQLIKNKISTYMQDYLISLTKNAKSSEEAQNLLLNNYDNINSELDKYLKTNKLNTSYEINIGRNYFPTKNYKGVDYSAGYYDSVVINLGHKQGVNWWCVMYPPLCLIDEKEELDEVEYTSYVSELLKKYNI
ncbi:MAG: stage II sporulation protein R [Bacilli bacterium]|nr:stage II sporulation protein R [Bacilli bacterium]